MPDHSEGNKDFQLLETMLVSSHQIYLLDRHLDRLAKSATYFEFVCNANVIGQKLHQRAVEIPSQARHKVRLLVSRDGSFEIQVSVLTGQAPHVAIALSPVVVDSRSPFLCHKTTARNIYEDAQAGMPAGREPLLTNERGEVTEGAIGNIAVLRGGKWVTPPVSCGLLPGVMRAELLDRGEIVEGVILARELIRGETVRHFNSVRGVVELPLELA